MQIHLITFALLLAACDTSPIEPDDASTTGASFSLSETGASTGEEPDATGDASTGESSSTGEGPSDSTITGPAVSTIPAQACFGAPCSADLPCGEGLRCLAHPDDGAMRCAVAGCITGSPCDGNAYACGDPLLGAPLGLCDDATGQGQCHARLCDDDNACEAGWCVDGQCY